MAQSTRICKICGIEYPYCKTENRGDRFRYQDVACCPEHGSIYFAKIAESRSKPEIEKPADTVNDFSDLIDEEDDTLFEEDFEDEDDDDNAE